MARRMRPVTLEEIEARMSPRERARVDKLTAEMRAEEMSLAQIRKARSITQSILARRLGKSQALVSHVESAGDVFVSTLRKQIEALGGKLDMRANFPDMPAVSIAGFVGAVDEGPAEKPIAKKRVFKLKAKRRKALKGFKVSGARHTKRRPTARPHRIAAKA